MNKNRRMMGQDCNEECEKDPDQHRNEKQDDIKALILRGNGLSVREKETFIRLYSQAGIICMNPKLQDDHQGSQQARNE